MSIMLIAVFLARITPREFGLIVVIFAAFAFSWFLIQSWLMGGSHILVEIGPLKLAYEGMNVAGAVALRSLVLVGLARTFIGTTEPRQLALALVQGWRLPYPIAFSILYMMRLLPLFEQEFTDLSDARKIRAADVGAGLRRLPEKLFDYTKVLLIRGFRRSAITSYSLDSRAFRSRPDRTFVTKVSSTREGRLLIIMSVAVTLIFLLYIIFFSGGSFL